MKKYSILILLALGLTPVFSQTFFDEAIKKSWKGEGVLLGSDAKFQMKWEKVLEGQFYRLEFMNQRDSENGKIVFKAISMYKPNKDTSFEGTWFDSRGISFPLKGSVQNNKLVVNWGTPETELGKSIYTINDNGTISVEDYIEQNKEEILFAKATYK